MSRFYKLNPLTYPGPGDEITQPDYYGHPLDPKAPLPMDEEEPEEELITKPVKIDTTFCEGECGCSKPCYHCKLNPLKEDD